MTRHPITIYDDGRLPVWWRVPLVAVGFLILTFAIKLLATYVFGIQLLALPGLEPLPLAAVVVWVCLTFFIGLALCNTWVARKRILVEPDVGLVVEIDWLGGTRRRAVPFSRVRAIEVEPWMGKHDRILGWRVNVRLDNNRLVYLTWFVSQQEAEKFAERLSSMPNLSLALAEQNAADVTTNVK